MSRWRALAILSIALLPVIVWGVRAQYELESALTETVPCGPKELEVKLKQVMNEALEQALLEHIQNTYEVWMKDETDQPRRAATGIRKGINAYIQATNGISRWQLMTCLNPTQP